jgi:hypothetical protein
MALDPFSGSVYGIVFYMKLCKLEDCTNPSKALNLCDKHYKRFKAHGDTSIVKVGHPPKINPPFCVVEGCDDPTTPKTAKGLCVRHYKQQSSADRLTERRAFLDAFKIAKGCTDCGYAIHPAVLEFDHLPQFTKSFDIGRAVYKAAWTGILEEIAKCEVVCANCHRIRTVERRGESLYSQISRGEVVLV